MPGSSASLAARWRFLASCASSSVASSVLEIGAGILQVVVEEERIEPAVEVVVMGDVPLGAERRVHLAEAAREVAGAGIGDHPPGDVGRAGCWREEREEIVDRAGFDDEAAVHELLAELELGIEDDVPLDVVRVEAHAHRRRRGRRRSGGSCRPQSTISSDPSANRRCQGNLQASLFIARPSRRGYPPAAPLCRPDRPRC